MAATKLTIDLTDENKATLEKIKTERRMPYGSMINSLISTFGDIPEVVKKELLAIIKPKIKELYKEMDTAGDYQFRELANQSQAYIDIATFLNDGNRISLESLEAEPTLKKYKMKDGILICPDNWIVINAEQADTMMYAGVVECRNSERFGTKNFGRTIPHFVFFSNKKYGREYDDYYISHINRLCVQAWPDFQMVIDSQVEPIDDPERPGYQINAEEWMNAPTIGHFAIYEQGDPIYGSNYQPPAGARIIRTINTED